MPSSQIKDEAQAQAQAQKDPERPTHENERRDRYRICVDFDGVLHSYSSGWQGVTSIPDRPVPGAVEWLKEMVEKFDVDIFSTRASSMEGHEAIEQWLRKHGFPMDSLVITHRKRAALIYIDDRGYRFDGENFPSASEIHRLRPWWNK